MAPKGKIILTGAERQARLRARQLAEQQAREAQVTALRQALLQIMMTVEKPVKTKADKARQLDIIHGVARRTLAHIDNEA